MSFRAINTRYLEPLAMGVMIFGIIALCQPWNLFMHRYGLLITIIGLIGFLVSTHIPPEPEPEEE